MLKRLQHICKDKSGASLVFILAFWLLFLALGTSAIFAASTAVGADLENRAAARLELQADSLQRTIRHGLQDNGAGSLGERILVALYNGAVSGAPGDIALTPALDGGPLANSAVAVETGDAAIEAADGGALDEPGAAVFISGNVTVRVTAGAPGRQIITAVRYRVPDTVLYVDGTGAGIAAVELLGEWGFISYEKSAEN